MKRRVLSVVPLAILALLLALRAADPLPIEQARLLTFDVYQRLQPRTYDPRLPVRVVVIDDASLARLGQWPWPRTLMARLVDRLGQAGVAALAFDIAFAEPDRSSPEQVLSTWPSTPKIEALRQSVQGMPSHDSILARAISQAPVVTGFILTHRDGTRPPAVKGTFVHAGDDPRPFVPGFSGAVSNLPVLEAAAVGDGALNSTPDRDQVIRSVPLVLRLGDTLYPSLAAEAFRVAVGAESYLIKSSGASGATAFGQHTGLNTLRIGQSVVPTDAHGRLVMHFRNAARDSYIPAWRVLEPDFDNGQVAGRIVFIGATAPGLLDLRATSLEPSIPGVELHAQVVEQILTGDFLRRPDFAKAAELAYMLVLGLGLIYLLSRVGAVWSLLIGAGATVGVAAASWLAFDALGWLLDPVYPSFTVFFVFLSATVVSYLRADAEKRQVRHAFSHYLAPALVKRLAENPAQLKLGGEARTMSVMFADIRDFTALSERFKDDPEGLTALINRFLTPMTEAVLAHGGTIDKYIGDCLMGFWNAPLDDQHHAENACRAALDMAEALERLNRELAAEGHRPDAGAASDLAKPFDLLRRDAQHGFANAQYKLGKAYRDGAGVARDPVAAAKWFRMAAEQDHARAQHRLGDRYAGGDGVPRDPAQALFWLTLAVRKELPEAEEARRMLMASLSAAEIETVERQVRAWQPNATGTRTLRLEMGVGVSTGRCVVGNLGSKQRFDYSVLGDSVNLASRLEGQTKYYGVGIIVGEETHRLAPGFAALELDLITVKGKREATRIYGLIGGRTMAETEEFRELEQCHRRMLAAYRACRWDEARDLLEQCANRDARLEYLYETYRDRIAQYEREPPPPGWDGVFVARAK